MTDPQRTYQRRRQRRERKRRLSHKERLGRRRRQAQAYLDALEHSFVEQMAEMKLEERLRNKLRRQGRLLGELFAMMFSTAFGGGSYGRLSSRLGINKNLPGGILTALGKKSWLDKFRQMGRSILAEVLDGVPEKSSSTKSRYQVTLDIDSTVFRKFSEQMRLVGRAYSGQTDSVVLGVDVLLLVAVVGEGKLIVPMDFAIRRPDPDGPGRPCHDKMRWTEILVQSNVEWLLEHQLIEKPPLVAADSWFGSSHLAGALEELCGAALLVHGKAEWVFYLDDGRRLKGKELLTEPSFKRKLSPQVPKLPYQRLLATSPSFGRVVLTVVWPEDRKEPAFYLLCRDWMAKSTCLLRAWQRRSWIEWCFRVLKHLLEAGKSGVHTEEAFYGHLALRLMALTLLSYTARRRIRGEVTIEQLLWSIEEHWQCLRPKTLNLEILSTTSFGECA
jgi:hypothetical protein